jgi:glycosyltransferase involved in cell wall biosynthesis
LKLLWEPLETIGMRFPTVFRVVGTRGSQRIAEYFASAKYFQPDLIDWVEPAEVPNVVAGFDVGVMPLVDEEYSRGKCGLKALEYMAVGVPTVCSPVGVNKDIIRDGVNGFLAASAEGWVRAFEQIRADRHLRQRMMLEARRTIETEYDVRVLARRLVEIMESVRNNSLR